ncbi:Hsp20/alpha crystallin family protein [Parafrankia sp. FMc2]|uniref:Hsp20/alpha crystallin family protein n=1 Tax=Parafrankia sp. FMc2 TaxID=3233196 RepID=UPI0034D49271
MQATRQQIAPDDARHMVAERPTGAYRRQIALGDGLNVDAVTANYVDGVLTVTIPVAEQAKPRHIEIGRDNTERKIITA